MTIGLIAALLAMGGGIIVAVIGWLSARAGVIMNRRTSLDQIYMERLKVAEEIIVSRQAVVDQLRTEMYALREKCLEGDAAKIRCEELKRQLSIYENRHRLEAERTGET